MRTAQVLHREDKCVFLGNLPLAGMKGRGNEIEYLLRVPLIQPTVDLFGTETTMSESERVVLHINDVNGIQMQISTNPKKALYATAGDMVLRSKWRSRRG